MLGRLGGLTGGDSGASSGGSNAEKPLWHTVIQDYERLSAFKSKFEKKRNHTAMTQSRDWVAELLRLVEGGNSAASGGMRKLFRWGGEKEKEKDKEGESVVVDPVKEKENEQHREELFRRRVAQLSHSEAELKHALQKSTRLLNELKGNISSLILFELPDHEVRRYFGERPQLLQIYERQRRIERGGSVSRKPYQVYESWINELRPFDADGPQATLIRLLRFLYIFQAGYGASQVPLASIIFECTRGHLVKDMDDNELPNWPALRNCFAVLNNIRQRLQKEKKAVIAANNSSSSTNNSSSSASNSKDPSATTFRISTEELDFVLGRLNIVQTALFNLHSSIDLKMPFDISKLLESALVERAGSPDKHAKKKDNKKRGSLESASNGGDKEGSASDKDSGEKEKEKEEPHDLKRDIRLMFHAYITDDLDKGIMADYISTNEYVMGAFREVVERNSIYNIMKVEGDGNCFFRAVVKYHFPDVPRDWEDQLSLNLRLYLNKEKEVVPEASQGEGVPPSPRSAADASALSKKEEKKRKKEEQRRKKEEQRRQKELKKKAKTHVHKLQKEEDVDSFRSSEDFEGFVINDLTDADTMAKAGVWADHVQVEKLARRLRRPIWLLTFDDTGLHTQTGRDIQPGPDYCIGAKYAKEESIKLYFTPTPGHYEALQEQKDIAEAQDDAWKQLTRDTANFKEYSKLSPILICNGFFSLAQEGERIQKLFENFTNASEMDLIKVLYTDMNDRAKRLFSRIKQLQQLLQKLDEAWINNMKEHRSFPIYEDIIMTLIAAAKTAKPDESGAGGPLAHLQDMTNHVVAMAQEKHAAVSAVYKDEARLRAERERARREEMMMSNGHGQAGSAQIATNFSQSILGGFVKQGIDSLKTDKGPAGGSSPSHGKPSHHSSTPKTSSSSKRSATKLASQDETTKRDWQNFLMSSSTKSTIKIKSVNVSSMAIAQLIICFHDARQTGMRYVVEYIVFNKCHFSVDGCNLLRRDKLPKWVKVVQLNQCKLDLKEQHLHQLMMDNSRLRVAA